MGAPAKAKQVRLIDILYSMNPNDFIIVTINNGRNSLSNRVAVVENQLREYLTVQIKGLTVNSGTIQVFL